jgi:S1-C subfamily serine protease
MIPFPRPLRIPALCAALALPLAAAAEAPLAAAVPATDPVPAPSQVENSVVKIYATMRAPDTFRPWTKQAPGDATGSGVVIEGNRILTNAHVVLYASQVQVQANQSGEKISATVEAIAPGIDLAVLKLDDEALFATHRPLPFAAATPEVKDIVMAYGFPTGGTELSITKGIVSRIEFSGYGYNTSGLRIQIDAAINPGNSGGPAVVGDKMIGLTFSHLGGAENIGYIIPSEEIQLFLRDIADGTYDGKPALFDEFQTLENTALRTFLKLPPATRGLAVHKPADDTPAYPLHEWDVITRIGDTPIDEDGMIRIGPNLRVYFAYEAQHIVRNGKIPLAVVRDGKELAIELPVTANRPQLIPDLRGDYPSYFIFGPIVFSKATMPFVYGIVGNKAQVGFALGYTANPLLLRIGDQPAFPGEELVVVCSPFFPHKLVKGYDNPIANVVKTVNGVAVKNLAHLVSVLRDSRDEFIEIAFDRRSVETQVFKRQELLAATEDILSDNGVRAQGSPDMLEIWNAKPAK